MNCDEIACIEFEFCKELIQINPFALKGGDVAVNSSELVINDAFYWKFAH
jgi:hypothetical protein